ncbi:hypothetical protein NPIL_56421 [Nephila pilipes]|uniref:Uncharacterized protein n=1 Tax=Nephila pilipes TaxID=299642 RepID=A0A8X6NZ58_NEPPI|nr:hypothetical protein NPIL_56421 [Nephila pilipes]
MTLFFQESNNRVIFTYITFYSLFSPDFIHWRCHLTSIGRNAEEKGSKSVPQLLGAGVKGWRPHRGTHFPPKMHTDEVEKRPLPQLRTFTSKSSRIGKGRARDTSTMYHFYISRIICKENVFLICAFWCAVVIRN